MTSSFTESVVRLAALAWLEAAGWRVACGLGIAPDAPAPKRREYGEVALALRLRDSLARLNPTLPAEALEDALRKITRAEMPSLLAPNALPAVPDGIKARVGKLGAGREWFKPWRTVAGDTSADAHVPGLQEA